MIKPDELREECYDYVVYCWVKRILPSKNIPEALLSKLANDDLAPMKELDKCFVADELRRS